MRTPKTEDTTRPYPLFAFRLFVTAEGVPGAGALVSFVGYGDAGEALPLATLQADQKGYVSFKTPIEALERISRVEATVSGDESVASLSTDAEESVTASAMTLRIGSKPATPIGSFPAVLEPDAHDARLSPGSLAARPRWNGSEDPCSPYVPTGLTRPTYPMVQYLLEDPCDFRHADCGKDGGLEIQQGIALNYEVTWFPIGFSLGGLLYSTSLAPCEQIKLAVRDVVQQVSASREERTAYEESQALEANRASTVEEQIKATTWGASSAVGAGLSASVSGKVAEVLDISVGVLAGVTAAADIRQTSANTVQRVSDSVSQHASLSARRSSMVVYEASQSESQLVATRTISNHNRCHTLNLMYYGVNQSFRVLTRCTGARDILLIRYDNESFDVDRAACRMHLLRGRLLLSELESCWEALMEYASCCTQAATTRDLTVQVDGDWFGFGPRFLTIRLTLKDGSTVDMTVSVPSGGGAGLITATGQLPTSVSVDQVVKVEVAGNVFIKSASVTAKIQPSGDSVLLASGQDEDPSPNVWGKAVSLAPPGVRTGCEDLACCSKRLVDHLNCNKLYYNSLIWMAEDPNERFVRLRCCKWDKQYLLSLIENRPIGVIGDMVAFPKVKSQTYDDLRRSAWSLATLPTKGVHAEGILGVCNTCEKKDDTVYRDCACCGETAPDAVLVDTKALDLADILKPEEIKKLLELEVPDSPKGALMSEVIKELLAEAQKGSDKAREMLEKILEGAKPEKKDE